jgi:8-oxo-dGTP diphosphatase
MEQSNRYVLGLGFTPDRLKVALIRKRRVRPGFEWMQGLMNGLGGKVREDELSVDAMVREFKEESGVELPRDAWSFCGSFHKRAENWEVFVYSTFHDDIANVKTASPGEGKVYLVDVPYLNAYLTTPALKWIIPLVLYRDLRVFDVEEK